MDIKTINTSKIKNLIFDVGGVLLEYRWKEMLFDYGLTDADADRIGAELFDDPDELWHIFDLGTMTDEEITLQYCKKYPADAKAISWFISHGEYMHKARPEIWQAVHSLKEKGYKIYLLSNYPEKLFKKHTEYADFMNDIDGLMVSYMINKAKPDPAIYEALLGKYSLNPEECLFFDDREENIDGARCCGINARIVKSRKSLFDDLEELLNE